MIPQKIAEKLRNKIDEAYVSLTGPSGAIWKVELAAIGDTLSLKNGWKEFVDAHRLEENDLVIFKYVGSSQFDVWMFDGQSSCAKEASFFLTTCEHPDLPSGSRTKRPRAVRNDTTNDVSEAPAKKKSKASTPALYSSKSSSDEYEATTTPETSKSSTYEHYTFPERRKSKFASATTSSAQGPRRARTNLRPREIKSTSARTGENTSYQQSALDLATVAATPNSCVVVLKRSHVTGPYYMTFPSEWARIHLPHKDLDVTLQNNEKTWKANFTFTGRSGALGGDWKRFVIDNFLNVSDVCMFNLVSGENEDPILDVRIFRYE